MTTWANGVYRPSHIGFSQWGIETGMLAPNASAIEAEPGMQGLIGYGPLPTMTRSEGSTVIGSVGSYNGVALIFGDRHPEVRLSNYKINCGNFLGYLFRSSGYDGYYCQPPLAIKSGATSVCNSSSAFSWCARYCMPSDVTIRI